MLKHSSYFEPAVSALQDQCQLSTSVDLIANPPDVVPNCVLAAKQTQVLNIAHELEAWNLHALQASSLLSYALSFALLGRSTTGIGGLPFLAGDGRRLSRRSFELAPGTMSSMRMSCTVRIFVLALTVIGTGCLAALRA